MPTLQDNVLIYINNKVDDHFERFTYENVNRYIDFYEDINFPVFKEFFSSFHFYLNKLFIFLNGKLKSNRHYNAYESRQLMFLIDEIYSLQSTLKGTEYYFTVIPYYKGILDKCERFLVESGGSAIPHDFEFINLIDAEPIFTFDTQVSISRADKNISFPTKTIGTGSYATVHKYKDDYYNRFFVIKKAKKDLTKDEYERFKREFEEMKKLNSPYVIEVYHFDDEKQQYVMEFADDTLDSYILKNNGIMGVKERVNLVRQILRAFIYINSKGVLHRDISTKNILIKKYEGLNVIKVSDFGLVKLEDSVLTNKNTTIKGYFNDPKLELIGFDKYTILHETYALTRIAYFVMTGKVKLDSYKNNDFKKFIEMGIADDPFSRYKDVEELQDAFNKIVHTLS
ncbi:protein kinase domain-containing protein [Metabacillus idriensis]|uniref:protein kinase domain-containing protein n=1 Tax=Metabacillus idriensis TaxID=324768 RepID=UPI001CD3621F|nr:protein kinase [Metabacillus idriensis]